MWGKIIGAMAGFAMGGPFGAVMGAAFGHAAEQEIGKGNFPNFGNFNAFNVNFGGGHFGGANFLPGGREQLFAVAVVFLAAKTAKIDGPVKRAEIDAFKRVFHIPAEAVRDIGHLFDRARDSNEDPLRYAARLGSAFADNPGTLEDVLTALFGIAAADGPVNARERDLLAGIARNFGLDRVAWERASGQRTGRRTMGSTEEDPYSVLGMARGASVEEARAVWKRLVRENHPDVLASHGASPDQIARASEKVARINAAWDRIKRERGAG
jgi:DnaJ like chaperone protein